MTEQSPKTAMRNPPLLGQANHMLRAALPAILAIDELQPRQYITHGRRCHMMPITIRIQTFGLAGVIGEPALLTTIGLRETLLMALDYDEARVNFVCRQVEETGTYELCDQKAESSYLIEKILHS